MFLPLGENAEYLSKLYKIIGPILPNSKISVNANLI